MRSLLSICMIVKNEERVLERCLQSVHGIADEIIIVDTGSNDRTKEIAAKYTDNVYNFEWIKDFSRARNYAASKASGEWILVIDADEYVDSESFKKFKQELSLTPPAEEVNAVEIVNFVGEEGKSTVLNRHSRFYKNNGLIKYERPIHEILVHKDEKETYGIINLKLYHSGYLSGTLKGKGKSERNLSLLLEQEEKKGIDYFYIGNEYNILGDTETAILYFKRSFNERETADADYLKKLLINLIDSLCKVKRYDEALEVVKGSEELYPNYADYIYYKGKINLEKENYKNAKVIFEYLLANKDNLLVDHSEDYKELFPLIHLASIYEQDNELHKAVEYYSRAVSLDESNDSIWCKLLYLLGKHSSLEELSQFINDRIVPVQGMTEQRMIEILLNVPLLNVQKLSRSLLNHEKLTPIENEALWVKNYLLDHNHEEVYHNLENKTIGEMIVILNTSIFTIADYIIQAHERENEKNMVILYQIGSQSKIDNILNLLFREQHKRIKLSQTEQNLFINIYRQAKVLGVDSILYILDKKVYLLDELSKEGIIKLRNPA